MSSLIRPASNLNTGSSIESARSGCSRVAETEARSATEDRSTKKDYGATKSRRKASGVALITAMLITALTATVATSLSWDNALDVRRTMVLLYHEQGVQVALGAESWIRSILRDDDDPDRDHLDELWASELPALPIDSETVQGIVTGQIEDLHSKFNVNNLIDGSGQVDPNVLEQFENLLRALQLDNKFAGLTADWLDSDQEAGLQYGAEDPIYTGFVPPYRTSNRPIANVTELAALEGMDKATFDTLLPYITALPPGTKINVNTASIPVLMSLDPGFDESTAESILSQREDGGLVDFNATFDALNISQEMRDQIGETSQYFRLNAIVQIDTVRITYFSILHRSPNGGPVTPISRSLGTL